MSGPSAWLKLAIPRWLRLFKRADQTASLLIQTASFAMLRGAKLNHRVLERRFATGVLVVNRPDVLLIVDRLSDHLLERLVDRFVSEVLLRL